MNKTKKVKPKRQRRFTIPQTVVLVLGLLAAIAMIAIFYYLYNSAKHSTKAISQSGLISTDDKSWMLRVVNANSGLSADTDIVTSAITDVPGMYVDSRATKETINLLTDLQKAVDENVSIGAAYTSVAAFVAAYDENIANLEDEGYTHDEAVAETLSIMMPPGTDEHSTGLLINFSIDGAIDPANFANTEAYTWLQNNAWRYGYVLRYPEGKESITLHGYDPTAYRYVGKDYAKALKDNDLTLEEYNDYLAQQAAAEAAQAEAEAQAAAEAEAAAQAEVQNQ